MTDLPGNYSSSGGAPRAGARRIWWWIVAGFLVALTVCEIGLRFTRLKNVSEFTRILRPAEDTSLPWRLRPGVHVVSRGLSGECPPVDFDINAEGFRDDHLSRQKASDTFRIVALGDADTFGESVQLAETWPKVLERRLRETVLPSVEVYNRGVPGYDLDHFPKVLSESWSLEPDLIILEVCDVTGANKVSSYFFDRRLFHWSYIYRLFVFLSLNGFADNAAASIAGIADVAAQCDAHHVPLAVFELKRAPDIDTARALGLAHVRPYLDWLQPDQIGPYESPPCASHPASAMHHRIADALVAALSRFPPRDHWSK